ncbi:MAG TPA: S8 family serine peptidase [Phycisphaerae bacterium]|nr:S8 family serine peptidase [Phycisphaerae bacterium]
MPMLLCAVSKRSLQAAVVGVSFLGVATGWGSDLETIGITELRSIRPDLTGAGVTVGQIEATTYNGPANYDPQYDLNDFEYNPSVNPNVMPTYVGKQGTTATTVFNSAYESGHADLVATNLFGTTAGAAPGVAANVAYNANYFFSNVVVPDSAMQLPLAPSGAPPVSIVSQSFIFGTMSSSDQTVTNQYYDNFVVNQNVMVVTAVGNSGGIQVPATAYNVISVGDSNGETSVGPTSDGRSKPDISAPGGETSFSTPYVSGVAAVLEQAGATGAGGSNVTAAVDGRTIKALLLAGASKTLNWSHTTTAPLDPTYGAGVVNAYASYETLSDGQRGPTVVNTSLTPSTGAAVESAGWDLNTLTTQVGKSVTVSHYVLNITANSTLSSALTWYRPAGAVVMGTPMITGINNLDLMLYNSAGVLVDSSVSTVDNVEYLYTQNLTPGTYDLEVVKRSLNKVSASETYGLAFNAMMLGDADLDGKVDLTDLSTVLTNIGMSTTKWTDGNFDGTGTVDLTDLSDVLNNFGAVSGNLKSAMATGVSSQAAFSQVAMAPEPGSLAIMGGAAALLLGRRRKQGMPGSGADSDSLRASKHLS